MEFKYFAGLINSISDSRPVVLLEGKREVKVEDKHLLIYLGKKLAAYFPYVTFRTGNARGADELFAKGVSEINSSRLEYILPYKDHRKDHISKLSYSVSVDGALLANEPRLIYQTKLASIQNSNIIDQYGNGIINKISIKASYLVRDTIKVLGSEVLGLKKADIAIFYDDMGNPGKGGTGHTMRVCAQNNVPAIIQKDWFNWL